MTPEDALTHLHRDGWNWTIYSQHDSDGKTRFHICGARIVNRAVESVSAINADLEAAVAEANALADYDPYASAA